MRGVGRLFCDDCRRTFGGDSTFSKHMIGAGESRRCRTVRELRKIGLHQRPEGTWVRPNPLTVIRQLRLIRLGRPRNRRERPPLTRSRKRSGDSPAGNPALFSVASGSGGQ
ncbi:MAG: hypothetical protein ACRDH8_12910 [Actinomycetota bacterium]